MFPYKSKNAVIYTSKIAQPKFYVNEEMYMADKNISNKWLFLDTSGLFILNLDKKSTTLPRLRYSFYAGCCRILSAVYKIEFQ